MVAWRERIGLDVLNPFGISCVFGSWVYWISILVACSGNNRQKLGGSVGRSEDFEAV